MEEKNPETAIMKVWKKKKIGQKLVTVPKKSKIEAGDYVLMQKIDADRVSEDGPVDNESSDNHSE